MPLPPPPQTLPQLCVNLFSPWLFFSSFDTPFSRSPHPSFLCHVHLSLSATLTFHHFLACLCLFDVSPLLPPFIIFPYFLYFASSSSPFFSFFSPPLTIVIIVAFLLTLNPSLLFELFTFLFFSFAHVRYFVPLTFPRFFHSLSSFPISPTLPLHHPHLLHSFPLFLQSQPSYLSSSIFSTLNPSLLFEFFTSSFFSFAYVQYFVSSIP